MNKILILVLVFYFHSRWERGLQQQVSSVGKAGADRHLGHHQYRHRYGRQLAVPAVDGSSSNLLHAAGHLKKKKMGKHLKEHWLLCVSARTFYVHFSEMDFFNKKEMRLEFQQIVSGQYNGLRPSREVSINVHIFSYRQTIFSPKHVT